VEEMNKIRISAAVLPNLWKRFQEACAANDESASRRLGILIKKYLETEKPKRGKN
jgi:hypothetical protein